MRNAVIFVVLSALTPVAFSQLHDFILVPLKVNWSEAQAFCREHYTDLATVSDKEDNDNLLKVLANATSWIGLHRTSSTSPLIWSDQSGSTFSDWAADQPNNYAGRQWCVNVLSNKWNDQECWKTDYFVCHVEKKRRQIVRLEVKSGRDLNDPEVKKEVIAKMEQILTEKGVSGEDQLSWTTQSDGNVFQMKDRKSCQTCL